LDDRSLLRVEERRQLSPDALLLSPVTPPVARKRLVRHMMLLLADL
jgi:hypothetical protein